MEFILEEEFLKQPKEVQNVINNSIKLNIGDRIYHKLSKKYYSNLWKNQTKKIEKLGK